VCFDSGARVLVGGLVMVQDLSAKISLNEKFFFGFRKSDGQEEIWCGMVW
jgi:hypothetical protein